MRATLAMLLAVAALLLSQSAGVYAQGRGVEVRDRDGGIVGRQGTLTTDDPLEPGVFVAPVLVANSALVAALLLHQKGKLGAGPLRRLLAFETSKRASAVALSALLALYVAFSAGEIFQEETFPDFAQLKHDVERWPSDEVGVLASNYLLAVDYFLLSSSLHVFGNMRFVPLVASITLLFMTYLATVEMARKRFAGIIAVVALMQSRTFLDYDTVVSYDNFWVLFYVVSLYMILRQRERRWGRLSPLLYYLSIASKPLAAAFAPMSLHFIYRAGLARREKLWAAAPPYLALAAAMAALAPSRVLVSNWGFDWGLFWDGANTWPILLAQDGFVFVLVLPLVLALYFKARKQGVWHAESIIVFITVNLLVPSLLFGFTAIANTAYRAVPLFVFFAMGVGMLFANPAARKEGDGPVSRAVSRAVLAVALAVVVMTLTSAVVPSLIPSIAFR